MGELSELGPETGDRSSRGESLRTVVVAFGANLGVAIAKSAATVLTGSAAMLAEAAHSWADTGNQVFLLIAHRRGGRAADADRPLGYGREAYVWSLLAAVGLFVVGGTVSVWHGVSELFHAPAVGADFLIAYVVLAVAFVLEGVSLLRAIRQLRGQAHSSDRDILEMRCRRPIRHCGRSSPRTARRWSASSSLLRDSDCIRSPEMRCGMRSARS